MQYNIPRLMLFAVLLVAFLVYRPGLHGPFMFDDSINVVNNQHLKIQDLSLSSLQGAAFSVPNGVLRRPVSMLSFSLNFYLDKDKVSPFVEAFPFKLTNLIIHLLNGVAIFVLTRLIVGLYRKRYQPELPSVYPDWLALTVSAAWLLHPLTLTSVLYVVQRMTSLSALFTIVGLIVYIWGRMRLQIGQRAGMAIIVSGLLVFTPLAALSKENGVLLPFFMLVIELTLFRFSTASTASRRGLIAFFVVCTALPVLLFISHVIQYPDWVLGGYINRDFTLSERLMTEARILWFYLRLIILPSVALMGMHHDDIEISRQLFDPVTTLPAILGVLALLVFAWSMRRKMPLVAFGILFFIVGHSIESSFIPLELAHEHRNYLPMYGVLLAFFHLLIAPMRVDSARLPRRIVAVMLIGLFAVGTSSRAASWGSSFSLWHSEVEHHPASVRSNLELGSVYARYASITTESHEGLEASYQSARHYYGQAASLRKGDVYGFFGLIWLAASHGKPVEESWLNELDHRLVQEVLPPDINDQLILLVNCRLQPRCSLTATQVERLLHAALSNTRATARSRALIYSAAIYYHFNVTHDYSAAMNAIDQAIELAPQEFDSRVWMVRVLVAMNRVEDARKYFSRLHQYDKQGTHAQEIGVLGKELALGG